ncbi:MAG TPA: hypothetical protein VGV90_10105 [Solirubrobacteraceae bacterium]|nr:hypothetical protein [Solirubrobacteraceae bacterium]
MTPHRTSTGIAALDELGRRMDAIVEPPRLRRLRPRRWAALALGVLALVAPPALAAVVFDGPERVEDALPEVAAAIDLDDPAATGRALERLGFRVRWMLITDNPAYGRDGESPTRGRAIAAPPPNTEILSVLDQDGGLAVDPDTRDLQIEVAPAGSDILATHR